MKILVALIAVFTLPGASAQKQLTGYSGEGNWTCQVVGEAQESS